ncbi:MAG TPA: TatD family hydrolase, partial [Gemmatimonadales bacterium]|nr:TatD family hydrolase [Gemmatimonadales bacterium]
VQHVVLIGESPESAARALELVDRFPRLSATAGLHPHEAKRWDGEMERWLEDLLRDPRIVGAGEMGLDYHYDFSPRDRQAEAFERQLHRATAAGKPAIIHAREADDDVAAILANHPRATVILHSFSSGAGLLRSSLDAGHYISFSGMVTFKNWDEGDFVRAVPADRLLVETDAPYLAPVPYRGKRNEPAYVAETARRLAALRGVPVEQLIAETGANAKRVFGGRLQVQGGKWKV